MNIPPVDSPRQYCQLSETQLALLDKWAQGEFEADYDPAYVAPNSIDEVPLVEQGDMLTRAALDFCLADAFHPGCEMTWPIRSSTLYMQPFRFLHARPDWKPPTLGTVFTSDALTLPNGPLTAQEPGSITRWMAVPWQTDTASCRSGYEGAYDPYVPTFWPARVPNQVLTKENYDIVMDPAKPMSERKAAFANRAAWIEPLGTASYTSQINNMISHFDHLGVVEVREGPEDGEAFPRVIEVEDEHRPIAPKSADDASENLAQMTVAGTAAPPTNSHVGTRPGHAASAADIDLSGIEKVRRFPGGLRR
jgi:hypothetical protein